ncbi:MAG: hypothetical protein Q4Q58_06220 [Thermoplasmata archaeon]|nr:hypothetical protein [Thermoplasmata archaeon]
MELTETFETSGERFGFSDVTAVFEPYKNFSVKWSRTQKRADFQVTDYMMAAPFEAVWGMADAIFAKIRGEDAEYPQAMRDWLESRDFLRINRPVYIGRCDGISKGSRGENVDLAESYARLVDDGLVEENPDIELRWVGIRGSKVSETSVLMKTVQINRRLDIEDISETTIDCVLLKQLREIELGILKGYPRESPVPLAKEFIMEETASKELNRMRLKF